MSISSQETSTAIVNPIDYVEDILDNNNWVYTRANQTELVVDVIGQSNAYRLVFIWETQNETLQILCQYDYVISDEKLDIAKMTLNELNAGSWMGHFEITQDQKHPLFRYATLFPHNKNVDTAQSHIEELVDIALTACEKNAPLFQILSHNTKTLDSHDLSLAVMAHEGEA